MLALVLAVLAASPRELLISNAALRPVARDFGGLVEAYCADADPLYLRPASQGVASQADFNIRTGGRFHIRWKICSRPEELRKFIRIVVEDSSDPRHCAVRYERRLPDGRKEFVLPKFLPGPYFALPVAEEVYHWAGKGELILGLKPHVAAQRGACLLAMRGWAYVGVRGHVHEQTRKRAPAWKIAERVARALLSRERYVRQYAQATPTSLALRDRALLCRAVNGAAVGSVQALAQAAGWQVIYDDIPTGVLRPFLDGRPHANEIELRPVLMKYHLGLLHSPLTACSTGVPDALYFWFDAEALLLRKGGREIKLIVGYPKAYVDGREHDLKFATLLWGRKKHIGDLTALAHMMGLRLRRSWGIAAWARWVIRRRLRAGH